MELEKPVFDAWGDIVVGKGAILDGKKILAINNAGVGELFIRADNTQDIEVEPIVSPEIAANVSKALRRVVIDARAAVTESSRSSRVIDFSTLSEAAVSLMEHLSRTNLKNFSVCGFFSLKDYNYVHPLNTASMSYLIGKIAGMDYQESLNMIIAALLQNFGYVLIPNTIREKAGPLNESEIAIIKKHPEYGAQILQKYSRFPENIITTIQQHHERWNGNGYPDRRNSQDILKSAQIIGIADTSFALASKRPHREEFLPSFVIEQSIATARDAIEFILAYSGELFNPELVRIFASLAPFYPTGVKVRLNNGQDGIVIDPSSKSQHYPSVRIIKSKQEKSRVDTGSSGNRDNGSRCQVKVNFNTDLALAGQTGLFISETLDY